MILDLYEALYNQSIGGSNQIDMQKMLGVLLPCSLKFYKMLDQAEINGLLKKM